MPATLAFGLLAFQVILPWTARYFMTMDGPSHLYNARVIGEILFHPSSPYRQFYQLRPTITTNWGTVLLFNLVSHLSATYAEPIIASLSAIAAFFSFFYLLRSLDPEAPCTPVINFLMLTWFLWVGFYNFYLGMALFAVAVGYYLRYWAVFTWRRVAGLALLLLATFFTHVFPVALAMLVIGVAAVWLNKLRLPARYLRLCVALLPALLLILTFILGSHEGMRVKPDVIFAWRNFPGRVFAETFRENASGTYLYPFMLAYLLLGIALLRKNEWSTARGALAAATAVCYAMYLVVPSHGFSGEDINSRVAWAVFLLGCAVAGSGERIQTVAPLVAVYVAGFLGVQLYHSMTRNVQSVSRAVEDYERATDMIPAGAKVVRIHFDTVPMSRKYGYRGLSLDPMYHAEAWMAARHNFIDLSDYQALSGVFALEPGPLINDSQRAQLWSLEDEDKGAVASLQHLLNEFPAPIDYVLVLGDAPNDFRLDGQMELLNTAGTPPFLRVYRGAGSRPARLQNSLRQVGNLPH